MANSINVGKAEERDAIGENEQLQRGKLNHDIRASLAISKGFNQALETSFSDLVAGYQLILDAQEAMADANDLQLLQKLEEDCRFCLSRASRSLTQLSERFDRATTMNNTENDVSGETH